MNKFFHIALVCLLAFGNNLSAQNKVDTKLRTNEKWWGFYVYDSSVDQPFITPFSGKSNQYGTGGSFTNSMLISSEGRYIWSNQEFEIDFNGSEITTQSNSKISIEKAGRNLREAYLVCCHKNFPPASKLSSNELILSPVYETKVELEFNQSQDKVLEYATKIIDEGFPAGTIVLCDGWQSLSGNHDFNLGLYPDPKAMVKKLHTMGFKVMLSFTPLITPVGLTFMNYNHNNLLLKNQDGSTLIVKGKSGYQACLNMSLGEVSNNLKQRLEYIKSTYEIDGFRYDASAVVPYLNFSGTRDTYMREWLSLGANNELDEYMPRSIEKSQSKINCFEDEMPISWQSLVKRTSNILSAGLSGYGFSHQLTSKSLIEPIFKDQRLMSIYLQLSAFMPVCSIDFAPWRIEDEQLRENVKQAFTLRANIKKYLEHTLGDIAKTSEPLVKNMEYMFPRSGFADCTNQFMLGDKYLVVIPEKDSKQQLVRLPRGIWITSSGNTIKGPLVINANTESGKILYYELK